ncbi:hypothetical protein GCM10011494_33570 [Novosphingobium endophyticum]|uniref:Uncharacterized protein n=1 Tax=Novosphingobium endophyticum TaxID=1955250 RepID=A0A916X5T6_9SPHN|nr:hypothetical protein [Novosphingobium endophyticum]GGC12068.1 hypothetical protein GCM10011494_33570 [Novosphingobium endophyticum]
MGVLSRGERSRPTVKTGKARLQEAGLDVNDELLEGIIRNLVVLQVHAATLDQFDAKSHHWMMEGRYG